MKSQSKPFRKPAAIPGTTAANQAEQAFIAGAGDAPPAAPPAPEPHRRADDYPWQHANERLKVLFQARIPEPLHEKMKFVKANTLGGASLQDILLEGVEAFCDARIAEILEARK